MSPLPVLGHLVEWRLAVMQEGRWSPWPGNAVLDIGCGTGRTTLSTATRAAEEGVHNASFTSRTRGRTPFPLFVMDTAPGARFVQLVWQRPERNEWQIEIQEALTPGGP